MNLRTTTCLLAAALLAAGCITPETRVRTQSFTQLSAPRPGPARQLLVHADVRGADIGVRAQYRRTCVRTVTEVVRTTRSTEAKLHDTSDLGRLNLLFFPVALASAIITSIVVATDDPEISETRHAAGARVTACPLAAQGLPLELAFASGTTLKGTTDARGTYRFAVPPGEPAQGVATLIAPGVQPQQLRYSDLRVAHRELAGPPASMGTIADRARFAARHGDCAAVRRFAALILDADEAYYRANVARDPVLQLCL